VRPAAPAPKRASPLDQLSKLADMHDSGLLTDAEFASEKARVLAQD